MGSAFASGKTGLYTRVIGGTATKRERALCSIATAQFLLETSRMTFRMAKAPSNLLMAVFTLAGFKTDNSTVLADTNSRLTNRNMKGCGFKTKLREWESKNCKMAQSSLAATLRTVS